MSPVYLVLIVILVLLLVGALPHWGYWGAGSGYGYYPSGILGVVLLIIVVMLLLGRL